MDYGQLLTRRESGRQPFESSRQMGRLEARYRGSEAPTMLGMVVPGVVLI
jgi:hypothetical protein